MLKPTVIGIDPGIEGAIAVLDGDSVILEPMPEGSDGKLDLPELVRLLAHYSPSATMTYLEIPSTRPGQAVQQTASQWRAVGRIEGALAALGARYAGVRPQVWSASFDHGVKEKGKHERYAAIKKARRGIAIRLYPGIDLRKTARSVVPHEGMVDALLIAHWAFALHTHEEGT